MNTASTYRKGEYFHKAVSVENSTGAVYQAVTVQASATNGTDTTTGNVFLPKTAETFTYDADGNLTSDGRWTNRWDAENRLIEMQPLSSIPDGAKKDLKFTYDSQGRRISKTVSNWTGSAWALSYDNRFIYDGWNLVAELNSTNAGTVCSYMWGLDLSGWLQRAGGVGGLLAISPAGNGVQFVAFDGNGNVAGQVSGLTGTNSAQFEYGPFGEATRTSGSTGVLSPLRFSTKYADSESDLLYYGNRFCQTAPGRWLNRDSIGEQGGQNLYAFSVNNSINSVDPLGNEIIFTGAETYREQARKLYEEAKKRGTDELKKKLAEIDADPYPCRIQVLFNSKVVMIGDFVGERIDLADIQKLPKTGDGATQLNAIIHEVIEQWEKRRRGQRLIQVAHKEASKWDGMADGKQRGAESTTPGPDGTTRLSIEYKSTITTVKDGKQMTDTKKTLTTITFKECTIITVETKEIR